jgi:hypothetical protein
MRRSVVGGIVVVKVDSGTCRKGDGCAIVLDNCWLIVAKVSVCCFFVTGDGLLLDDDERRIFGSGVLTKTSDAGERDTVDP